MHPKKVQTMKKILALLTLATLSSAAFAQNEADALRYSQSSYQGTARFSGMSGAYGAVGADFSCLSQNPAGIGLFRRSEFSITPLISTGKTESDYLGNSGLDSRSTFYLGNAGFVLATKLNGSAFKQVQFGFGVNRTALFNNRFYAEGENNTNSLLDQYVKDANSSGTNPDNLDGFGAGLAYDVNLIYQDTNNLWRSDLLNNSTLFQTKSIETRGGMTETVISLGTNYNEKLFLGVTFGFPHINYEENSLYTEKDVNDNIPFLKSFDRTEYLYTKGNGFNFKIGFIYKPTEFLRIGGAFHTPTTFYGMHDSWGSGMTANFDQPPLSNSNATRFDASSPDGYYDYELRTPLKAMGSIAFIIGQYGLVSADYEYIDYSTARLHAADYTFSEENGYIRSDYKSTGNLRLGTEWKYGIFAIRGGYSLYGSPYQGESSFGQRTGFSLGCGVREKDYFIDFAYNHSQSKNKYYLYSMAPAASATNFINSYSLTLGFKL
jgi:hypothetical protein